MNNKQFKSLLESITNVAINESTRDPRDISNALQRNWHPDVKGSTEEAIRAVKDPNFGSHPDHMPLAIHHPSPIVGIHAVTSPAFSGDPSHMEHAFMSHTDMAVANHALSSSAMSSEFIPLALNHPEPWVVVNAIESKHFIPSKHLPLVSNHKDPIVQNTLERKGYFNFPSSKSSKPKTPRKEDHSWMNSRYARDIFRDE